MTDHPNVRRFLDLSTAHLTPSTRDALDALPVPSYAHPEGYGHFVYMPDIDGDHDPISEWDEALAAELSDLIAVIKLARKLGCNYILFDCDGPECDELPTYDDDGNVIEDSIGDAHDETPAVLPDGKTLTPAGLLHDRSSVPVLDTESGITTDYCIACNVTFARPARNCPDCGEPLQ